MLNLDFAPGSEHTRMIECDWCGGDIELPADEDTGEISPAALAKSGWKKLDITLEGQTFDAWWRCPECAEEE